MRTCITPEGHFKYTIHDPDFDVKNLRKNDSITSLGSCDGKEILNNRNFPQDDLVVEGADRIYEIPNFFPFKGTTFINSGWADFTSRDPLSIRLAEPEPTSFSQSVSSWQPGLDTEQINDLFSKLPDSVLLALATTSTDPADLVRLAELSCDFAYDAAKTVSGLCYQTDKNGSPRPIIKNHPLFEAVANNPHLPEPYKQAMVLRPGAQGGSEIIGEWHEGGQHVFEYLRRNSYIPWGHYASNMANDAVRYHIKDLSLEDMRGLRHLYYQRTYVRMARHLGLEISPRRRTIAPDELETLREKIEGQIQKSGNTPDFDCTMWGWNYGFDFAPSQYRLNASHQQIHQQFAMLPSSLPAWQNGKQTDDMLTPFGCGDLVAECIREYEKEHNRSLFADLITNIRNNCRMDKNDGQASLIVYEDDNVMLFVPKAQISQWELQLIALRPVGNIMEADQAMRTSLDTAMYLAMQTLGGLGVKMVTTNEYSKRFKTDLDQRLFYSFLPKLPKSPGAFSEAQLRWITGHFPEDFAQACRTALPC